MKKQQFSIKIHAGADKVYRTMLDREAYREWTKPFSPTSDYEGSWEEGSKILFTSLENNGSKEGMIARIKENIPNRFVSIEHYGMLDGDREITEGPEVKSWAGSLENYTFSEANGVTTVTVDMDIEEDYMDQFKESWPRALNKLKEICER